MFFHMMNFLYLRAFKLLSFFKIIVIKIEMRDPMNIDIPNNKELEYDWEECYEWLKRCEVLNSDESIYQNQDPALFLMREVMDGVLLLNLLSAISNKQIDPTKYRQYTPNPKESQFDCVTNIKLFNKLLVSYFNISEDDIVDPFNVYSGKEFGKFILLLSKLSYSDHVKKSNIIGFPRQNHRITAEHEYYNRLEELAVKKDIYTKRRNDDEYSGRNTEDEKIYETLVQHNRRKDLEVPVNKSGREMCILEIVESEKNYLESLQILKEGYKKPMLNYMGKDEVDSIFKHIDEFYIIHKDLHSKLTIAIMPNKVNVNNFKKLHEIFIEAKTSLLLYADYCLNMENAQKLVQDMMKTNTVKRTELEKCQKSSDKFQKFPLSDLLTLPMQRILKYHLLLQTLLKWTSCDHPDFEGLKMAHAAMKDVASFVNDVKRDQEAILSINTIESAMTQIHLPKNKKLSDYGRRQKDGEIKVQQESDSRPKLRHVFIFDKMILLAKRKGDNYEFKDAFYLPDKYPEKTNIQPRKPEKVFPFTINITTDKKDKRFLILFTKSEEMRKQWMEAVEAAINNQYPPGYRSNGYYFEMTIFPHYEKCYFCHKLLRGAFYQGYKCRFTEKISHKECIPKPTSSRASLDQQDSESSIMSAIFNNVNQSNLFNNVSNESNGHKMNNLRMSNDARDPFDMLPFEPQVYYPKIRSRVDCYNSEPWYVGELEREDANIMLQESPPGTFLIRISKNQRRPGQYSLSIKDNEPKHMKIQKNDFDNTFYLEDANKFNDLRELVKHYSEACLNEYFVKLEQQDLKLTFPIKTFYEFSEK